MKRIPLILCLAMAPLSRAQAPQDPAAPPTAQLPVRPAPPTGTIAPPGFSIDVQPGGRITPTPVNPGGAAPAGSFQPAASAAFEPAVGRIGRPVEYRVNIAAGDRVTELPGMIPPDGLQMEPGPRGYSMTILNGELVGTSTLRYTAIPLRAGEHVVPGFVVNVGGRPVQVPAARLTVAAAQPGETAYQPVKAAIDVPKRDFFVGETIDARLLFIETPDEQPQFVQHIAKSSGGVVFKPTMRTRREQFTWDGKQANGLVMAVQITPLVAGETEVNCQVVLNVGKSDPLGRRGMLSQSTIDVPSTRFKVLPLPAVRPAGFTGGVGQFTLSQPRISATEVEAGEPITLSVGLTGMGNLEGVPPPELESGPEWTSYRPTSEIERADESAPGTKTFTYTLVAKRGGLHSTPPLPFAYFDPVKRAFVDVTVPPVPIKVKAAPNSPEGTATATNEPSGPNEPPKEVEPSLTGLAEAPGAWQKAPGPSLTQFLWLQLVPPALLLAFWSWRRRAEYLARHPEIVRRRQARIAARRALANARNAARRGDHATFLEASLGALREAAAPLDSTEATSLTREEVLRQVQEDERASKAVRTIFETAEASRYASRKDAVAESARLLPDLEHAVAQLSSRR